MTNAELISMVRSIVKHGADWRINKVLNRAADALEAAEQRIARLEEDLKTREAEREVMQDTIKVCEKRIAELEKQEPTEKQVVDYCHKRCLVIVEEELFQRMKATFSHMPKEGEWIDEQRGRWIYAKCNLCGKVQDVRSNYCPNCGARMKKGEEK